jgi:hypothetical protein
MKHVRFPKAARSRTAVDVQELQRAIDSEFRGSRLRLQDKLRTMLHLRSPPYSHPGHMFTLTCQPAGLVDCRLGRPAFVERVTFPGLWDPVCLQDLCTPGTLRKLQRVAAQYLHVLRPCIDSTEAKVRAVPNGLMHGLYMHQFVSLVAFVMLTLPHMEHGPH